jgi:hypothetical protein
MRVFLGMILGVLLMIVTVYAVDTMNTSSTAAGPSAVTNRTMVNWDVVETNWNQVKSRAREGWTKLSARIDRG